MPRTPDFTNTEIDRWEPTILRENQETVLRLIHAGFSNSEASKAVGLTPQQIGNIRNSVAGRTFLDKLRADANENIVDLTKRFQELAPEALFVMQDIMCDRNRHDATRASIAKDILDRAGYAPAPKSTREDAAIKGVIIDELVNRARENGMIEVPFEMRNRKGELCAPEMEKTSQGQPDETDD